MFVSSRFRDLLASDPATVYLSQLTAVAERIDPVADEDGDPLWDSEPSRGNDTARDKTARASAPVFIPAPYYKPEFIPAPVFKPEFIPAAELSSGDS